MCKFCIFAKTTGSLYPKEFELYCEKFKTHTFASWNRDCDYFERI